MPALTQGAYLLVNEDNSNIEFYISAFMTTSPSYLIMASLDYGRYYLDKYGDQDYEKLIILAEEWKKKINTINKVHILNKDDLEDGYDLDLSRYLIVLKDGYSGHKLLDYLRTKKIQAEMSFSSGVVLILSPFNVEKDFEDIYNSINELDLNSLKENNNIKYYNVIPSKVMEPYEVFESEWKFVDIEQCEGEIAKDAIVPYPPGIPLICAGEIISKEIIEIINNYIENNKTVIGVVNKKLKILDM